MRKVPSVHRARWQFTWSFEDRSFNDTKCKTVFFPFIQNLRLNCRRWFDKSCTKNEEDGLKGLEIRAENLNFFWTCARAHVYGFCEDNPLTDKETRPNLFSVFVSFCFMRSWSCQWKRKQRKVTRQLHVSSLTQFHGLCGWKQCFRSNSSTML